MVSPTDDSKVSAFMLLLTPPQTAQALAISPRKLWAMTDSGEIPCIRLGRSIRYDPADLLAWIAAKKKGDR